jgi:hypothetical protein
METIVSGDPHHIRRVWDGDGGIGRERYSEEPTLLTQKDEITPETVSFGLLVAIVMDTTLCNRTYSTVKGGSPGASISEINRWADDHFAGISAAVREAAGVIAEEIMTHEGFVAPAVSMRALEAMGQPVSAEAWTGKNPINKVVIAVENHGSPA